MKKYILILLICGVQNSFALTMGNIKSSEETSSTPSVAINASISTGSGPVKMITDDFIVIGKKQYSFANKHSVYDGKLAKGSFVRFLLNSNQEVQDIWIIK